MRCHVCYKQVISIKYGSYWDTDHFRFVSTLSDNPYYCGSPMLSLCSLKTLSLVSRSGYILREVNFEHISYVLLSPCPLFMLPHFSPSAFFFIFLYVSFLLPLPDLTFQFYFLLLWFFFAASFELYFLWLDFLFFPNRITSTQYKIKSSINRLTLSYFIKIKALIIYL